jgi:hypothetical protein
MYTLGVQTAFVYMYRQQMCFQITPSNDTPFRCDQGRRTERCVIVPPQWTGGDTETSTNILDGSKKLLQGPRGL